MIDEKFVKSGSDQMLAVGAHFWLSVPSLLIRLKLLLKNMDTCLLSIASILSLSVFLTGMRFEEARVYKKVFCTVWRRMDEACEDKFVNWQCGINLRRS